MQLCFVQHVCFHRVCIFDEHFHYWQVNSYHQTFSDMYSNVKKLSSIHLFELNLCYLRGFQSKYAGVFEFESHYMLYIEEGDLRELQKMSLYLALFTFTCSKQNMRKHGPFQSDQAAPVGKWPQ